LPGNSEERHKNLHRAGNPNMNSKQVPPEYKFYHYTYLLDA
jgi:hypothetical protein